MPSETNYIDLPFNSSAKELSLGVEPELQVLNGETLLLSPRASAIIDQAESGKFKQEFFQSTLEIITGICNHVQDVEKDLSESLIRAKRITQPLGLALSSTGTHPLADYRERLITPSSRYYELIDRNQWVIRRMAVYGMHIHLGMLSGAINAFDTTIFSCIFCRTFSPLRAAHHFGKVCILVSHPAGLLPTKLCPLQECPTW